MIASLSSMDQPAPPLPYRLQMFFIVCYVLIMAASLLGNLVVVMVIITFSKMRTVTNTFLLSLAVSDMLIAAVNMPLQLRFYLINEWTLGSFWCKTSIYIQAVTIVSSILTLTAIAVDRYYAIRHPLKAMHIHTIKRTLLLLIVFWILSFLLVSPQVMVQRLEPVLRINMEVVPPTIRRVEQCVEYFPSYYLRIAYTLAFYVILYLLPIVVMAVAYGSIAHTLWIRGPIGETPDYMSDAQRRLLDKRRVVRMLATIVVTFVILWFPFFTSQVYLLFCSSVQNMRTVLAMFQLLGYTNSCTNPLIYCFLNDSFRLHFSKIVSMCSRARLQKCRHLKSNNQPITQQSSLHCTSVREINQIRRTPM